MVYDNDIIGHLIERKYVNIKKPKYLFNPGCIIIPKINSAFHSKNMKQLVYFIKHIPTSFFGDFNCIP